MQIACNQYFRISHLYRIEFPDTKIVKKWGTTKLDIRDEMDSFYSDILMLVNLNSTG